MKSDVPIACSLEAAELESRVAAWRALAARAAEDAAQSATTRRLAFEPDAIGLEEVAALVRAELRCCPFYRFTLTADARAIVLEITSPTEAGPLRASPTDL